MNLRLIYDFSKLLIAMAGMGSGGTIDIGRVTSQKITSVILSQANHLSVINFEYWIDVDVLLIR